MNLKLTDDTVCRRCGTCCERGGPALHDEDRQLIESGTVSRRDLVAIRNGEPAYDQRQGQVVPTAQEFLKLAGARGSWRCKFYKPGGCGIYRQRPLECRLLFCRDTTPLEAVMGRDLLERRDLLAGDDPALEWLAKQEREVAYPEVMALLVELDLHSSSAGAGLARLTSLVRTDLALRDAFIRSFPERGGEELFLLGRPLFLTIAPYGCRLVEGPGGVSLQYQGAEG